MEKGYSIINVILKEKNIMNTAPHVHIDMLKAHLPGALALMSPLPALRSNRMGLLVAILARERLRNLEKSIEKMGFRALRHCNRPSFRSVFAAVLHFRACIIMDATTPDSLAA